MTRKAISLSRSSALRRIITLVLLGTLTVLVILKIAGFKASWERFRALNPWYIMAAFGVYYFAFLVRALRWKLLLRVFGHQLSIPVLYSYLLVGWFISAVVPARAGDVARAYLLKNDRQIPLRKGLGSIFVERGLDGFVILSGSLIFSFFILSLGLPKWILTLYQVTFFSFLLLLMVLYLMPKLESRVRGWFSSQRYQKLIIFLFRLVDNARHIARNPGQMILALAFTVIIWLCDALVTYLVLLSLDYPLPWPWVAFVSFTVNLVATVPITPGAVGQIDAVQFSLFSLIGVAREFSGVTIVLSRFICYWSFLLVSGLVTYGSGLARLVRGVSGPQSLLRAPVEPAATTKA